MLVDDSHSSQGAKASLVPLSAAMASTPKGAESPRGGRWGCIWTSGHSILLSLSPLSPRRNPSWCWPWGCGAEPWRVPVSLPTRQQPHGREDYPAAEGDAEL